MKKNSNKSLARYLCVQAIYQKILSKISFEEILEQFDRHNIDIFYSFENSLSKTQQSIDFKYFEQIIKNSKIKEKEINELIKSNLSEKWKIERLPILLNAILISAVSEIILSPKLSLGVVASEYISLTESFFLEKESAFVNAVISNIYNKSKS
tara:strand:+ start:689 stop:1147 length:459 start_codon:yes stop_codon:yes gene_type:complete